MKSDKTFTLSFASSLTDLCSVNSSFDSATLKIAYHGVNNNKSSISKETFERCLPTIYNVPVVCHYDRETDSIGGHDVEVFRDENGTPKIVNVTQPVGVVPESAKPYFAEVEEDNGVVHEYLFTDVLIWKRQEAYQKLKQDGVTSHSMEITVKDGELVDGIFNITDFEFKAFCLIGITPCFESSSLEFSRNNYSDQLTEMMHDLKESFNKVTSPEGDDDIHPQKIYTEGGKGILDEKMELVAKYGIDVESLDFSLDDFTVEELTEKFEAMTQNNEPAAEPEADPAPQTDENFALNSDSVEELRRIMDEHTYINRWQEVRPAYCYADCDFDKHEVYAWSCEDWLLYGFTFTADGDTFKIDFDSKKRMKYVVEAFEEGEQVSPFMSTFTMLGEKIDANSEWEAKYNDEHANCEQLASEVSSLREFKLEVETERSTAARNELFAKFEDLDGVEAFESLRESGADYELDVLEEKLFALRGRNVQTATFSLEPNKAPKLMVDKAEPVEDEPYGGIVEKYKK